MKKIVENKRTLLVLMVIGFVNMSYVISYSNTKQFKNITVEDGLPQSSIEAIYEDSNGHIWVGTNDGLGKYNGYDFKNYKYDKDAKDSIANNYILDIQEDINKNLWVATINGLTKIDLNTGGIKNYYHNKDDRNSLSNNKVSDILVLDDGKVIIATSDGLNIYNEESDNFERILENQNLLTNQDIYSMDQDIYGNIWIGTYDGLNKINTKQNTIKHFHHDEYNPSISENVVFSVDCDNEGYVWVGTHSNGLNKIDVVTDEVVVFRHEEGNDKSIPGDTIYKVFEDNDGRIWIGTDKGLSLYVSDVEFSNYKSELNSNYSLLSDRVMSIIQSNNGLIWLGTYRGISVFDPDINIKHYKNNPLDENSLSSNIIHGIYVDEEGSIWTGTDNHGVNIIENKNVHKLDKSMGLTSDKIKAIVGDDKYVWIGTREGVNRIDPDKKEIKTYTTEDGLVDNNIKTLYIDSRGYLLIGSPEGLNVLNIETEEMIDVTEYLLMYSNTDYVESIYEDKDGNYWIGTLIEGNILKVDVEKNEIENLSRNTGNQDILEGITAIRTITDDDNYVWIGTDYGLVRIDKDTCEIKKYVESDGLTNNYIYGIVIDNNGYLWLSTNNGVSKFNALTEKFTNYNITDGFQSSEFNGNAYYKDKEGEIYFGGINGLNVFDPGDMATNHMPSDVIIEEFKIGEDCYKHIDNKNFSYDENNIEITYFTSDFVNNDNVLFKYKLEGLETNWNETKSNKISYQNLRAGEYTLKIKSRNYAGVMSEENVVKFTISPHFLLSNTACVIYVLIIVAVIKYQSKRFKLLDTLVEKRTKELRSEITRNNKLHRKVLQLEKNKNNYFVNLSHELRTPLNVIFTTIQLLSELNKKEENIDKEKLDYHTSVMKKNTNRLLNLINNIIDTSKIEDDKYQITLREENIVAIVEDTVLGMKDYIESKGLELIIDPEIEEKIICCDSYEIERVIVNLISNAVKFTPSGGSIEVAVRDLGKKVVISVKDTGIGIPEERQKDIFDRFSQVPQDSTENKGGSGLGLTITKNLIKLHKGEIHLESEVNKGSMFIIILPINSTCESNKRIIKTP